MADDHTPRHRAVGSLTPASPESTPSFEQTNPMTECAGENAKQKCMAKNRSGNPCALPAGWGTSHTGNGRCKLHGGASTGPRDQRGNTNAQTHGLRSADVRSGLRLLGQLRKLAKIRY